MNKINLTVLVLGMIFLGVFAGCKKDFDEPPRRELPAGATITIDSLINLYDADGSYTFTEDIAVYGVVTTDEVSGSFYKELYFQDAATGSGMHMTFPETSGITAGDRIGVNLNGITLEKDHELLALVNVDPIESVFIKENLVEVTPQLITMNEINDDMLSRLIKLENVQIISDEACMVYATEEESNRHIEDCDGNEIILRNSAFSNFKDQIMPGGNGTFVGILSKYNDDYQLKLRAPAELVMNGERCNGEPTTDCNALVYLFKDFEDEDLNSGGWTTEAVVGTLAWEASGFSGDNFAKMSNYNGANNLSEAWMISPAVDLTSATTVNFSFITKVGYNGDPISVYVSTDYTSGSPTDATWTELNATLSAITGSWSPNWTSSGLIDLADYKTANTRVAFKYIGQDDDGCTWEVDDILITE